jgi:hypothetical protein
LAGFGTDDAFRYFLFVPFLLFAFGIECVVFFNRGASSPDWVQPTDEGEGLGVVPVAVKSLLSADS